jgi:AraC-like DNA-binding protein
MPGKLKQIERTEGSEAFALRTSLSELLHHFEELIAWHHRGSLVFDYCIDLTNGPGAALCQMMNYLFYELEHNALVLKKTSLRKSYDDMLLAALLSLPHNHNQKLFEDRRYQVAPGLVRRAEEYMRAHLDEAISIIDLLRICDCSRRTLFSAFRNARRYTPMEFLTEQRLQSSRKRLLKPHKEASVASIALDCGFAHLGRFSQVYRKRFGENPYDTLRKMR